MIRTLFTYILVFYAFMAGAQSTRLVDPAGSDVGDCTGAPCQTINYAIGQAIAGDIVELGAGTFQERVVIDKSLTLQGATSDKTLYILDGTTQVGNGDGIFVSNGITNVTIQDLTVQNYSGANGNTDAGIYAIGGNDFLTIDNVAMLNNVGGSGFYANGPVTDVTVNGCMVSGHTTSARAIVIWNGLKENITITNNMVSNNSCCGIELQDGQADNVIISNNSVTVTTGDSGMGLTGMSNAVVDNNTVNGAGRFGIEIKNPNGNVAVTNNNVTNTGASDSRDYAGIAVFRRAVLGGSSGPDVPFGTTVTGNTVTGYTHVGPVAEGFGIVVEGTGHTVMNNTVDGNDIGIQLQGGGHANPNYPGGDGDQGAGQSPDYFGRGNSPVICDVDFGTNTYTSNGIDARLVTASANTTVLADIMVGVAGRVDNVTQNTVHCSIQDAVDNANPNDVIEVAPGMYAENVIISTPVDLRGPNYGISPNTGVRGAEAIIMTATMGIASEELFHVNASDVSIDGFLFEGDNPNLTSGFTSTNSADIDAAEGVTLYEDGHDNLNVSNNIFQNLSYFGVSIFGSSFSAPTTSGHVVDDNFIQNMGTYDAASGISFWGGGVLIYNDQYTSITNNVMENVRIGVQTGNSHDPNPMAPLFQNIENNSMSVRRRGIFHNLQTGSPSPYSLIDNTITAVADPNESVWDGILLASLRVGSTTTGNVIDGQNVTIASEGIEVWNVWEDDPALIEGGMISNVDIGIYVNNFAGYNSDAGDGAHALIDNVDINPNSGGIGIQVYDDWRSTHAPVSAVLQNNIDLTSGVETGIYTAGSSSSLGTAGTWPAAMLDGHVTGIHIDTGSVATVENLDITNSGVGLLTTENGEASINLSNIYNNTFGVDNQTTVDIDATNNYWGDPSGPSGAGPGMGDEISIGVDICPWLTSVYSGTPVPTASRVMNTTTGMSYCSIQEAIDASAGTPGNPHIIEVGPGVFEEELVITNDNFELRGNNYGIDPCSMQRNEETIIYPPRSDPDPFSPTGVFLIFFDGSLSNVVIDGFTIDGDNPTLTSGVVFGGADVDAAEAISAFDGVTDFSIANNIIQNFNYAGIDMASFSVPGLVTEGTVIENNLIDNLQPDNFGLGIILHYNNYLDVLNNCISRVNVGVQTGNFYNAKPTNPGTDNLIEGNTVSSNFIGIWHNVTGNDAEKFVISNNSIDANAPTNQGIKLTSLDGVEVLVIDNTIMNGLEGVEIWNTPMTSDVQVVNTTVIDAEIGIFVNNYDGYNTPAGDPTHAVIDGATISGGEFGIYILDNVELGTQPVSADIIGNTDVTTNNVTGNGIVVRGDRASALIDDNLMSISGNDVGVLVDAGMATITNNTITVNNTGVRFVNSGTGVVNENNIFDNVNFGVENLTGNLIDATLNWWGDVSGPSGQGFGTGDAVSVDVEYCPWYDALVPGGNPTGGVECCLDLDLSWSRNTFRLCSGEALDYTISTTVGGGGITFDLEIFDIINPSTPQDLNDDNTFPIIYPDLVVAAGSSINTTSLVPLPAILNETGSFDLGAVNVRFTNIRLTGDPTCTRSDTTNTGTRTRIYPEPVLLDIPSVGICSGDDVELDVDLDNLPSINPGVAGFPVQIEWTVAAGPNISGASGGTVEIYDAAGAETAVADIVQTLTNTGTSAETVTYTITPTSDVRGGFGVNEDCEGDAITVDVVVGVEPDIDAQIGGQSIADPNGPIELCEGDINDGTGDQSITDVEFDLTGTIGGGDGQLRYRLRNDIIVNDPNVPAAGVSTALRDAGIGQTFINPSMPQPFVDDVTISSVANLAQPVTITYTFFPRLRVQTGPNVFCDGEDITVTVQINPSSVAITCPASIDYGMQCNVTIPPAATAFNLNTTGGNPDLPTVTATCQGTLTLTSEDVTTDVGCERTVTRTYTITDGAGATASCDQTFTFIFDETPPTFTACAPNVTIECDEDTSPANTGMPVATDNCCTGPAQTGNVLALGADIFSFIDDVELGLESTAMFGNVDQFDASQATPTLAFLQNYDAVLVWSDLLFFDKVGLGNVLADYVDGGGGVVIAHFSYYQPTFDLAGRFDTDDYWCLQPSPSFGSGPNLTLGTVYEPMSPLMNAVNTFDGGAASFHTVSTVNPNATVVADWSNGQPLILRRSINGVNRVDLNFFPVSEAESPGTFWLTTTDGWQIIANALEFAGVFCEPELTFSDVVTPGACPQESTITRTWTATDMCGNTNQCVQTITVDDSTPPVITCPPSVTINCNESTLPANTGTPTATDNCDMNVTNFAFTDVVTPGACPQESTITRTWTATDACGNTSLPCTQTITVVDNEGPVVTCIPTLTVELDENGEYVFTADELYSDVTDNCSSIFTFEIIPPLVSCNDVGMTPVMIAATDQCGNQGAFCTVNVTVEDNTPPILTCPGNEDFYLGADQCDRIIVFDEPTAMDECDVEGVAGNLTTLFAANNGQAGNMFNITNLAGGALPITMFDINIDPGTHTFRLYFSPGGFAGKETNPGAWTQVGELLVTSNGFNQPTPFNLGFTIPAGETYGVYITEIGGTAINYTNGGPNTYNDGVIEITTGPGNFGLFGGTFFPRQWNGTVYYQLPTRVTTVERLDDNGFESGDLFPIGEHCFRYRATDSNGNTSECEWCFTVIDFPNPITTLQCNDRITFSLDETCMIDLNADMILEGGPYGCPDSYDVIVQDDRGNIMDLDGDPSNGTQLGAPHIGKCYMVTVRDPDNGNRCWGTVCIEDKLPPVIVDCPDVTVTCEQGTDPGSIPGPTATDACDPILDVSFVDWVTDGSCDDGYERIISRRWTFTDDNGNSATCEQTIRVELIGLFDIVVPANYDDLANPALECDEKYDASKDVSGHILDAPFCVDGYLLDSALWLATGGDPALGDLSGTRLPMTLGWNCIENGPYAGHPSPFGIFYEPHPQWELLRLCWGPDQVTQWIGTGLPSGTGCSNIEYTYADTKIELADPTCDAGEIGCYKILRQWTLIDWCTGEVGGHDQIIKVLDKKAPEIVVPDRLEVGTDVWKCEGIIQVPAPWITDNCSEDLDYAVTVKTGQVIGNSATGYTVVGLALGEHTLYIEAFDCCGNTGLDSIILDVVDNTPPICISEDRVQLSLAGNQSPGSNFSAICADELDQASYDNCTDWVWFKMIRMDELLGTVNGSFAPNDMACGGVNGDDDALISGNQVYYDDCSKFCCEDADQIIMVVLRVHDVDPGAGPVNPLRYTPPGGDLVGHFTDCWVEIDVRDKAQPIVVAPPDMVVSCMFWFDDSEDALEDVNNPTFGRVVTDLGQREKVKTIDVVCEEWCEDHPKYDYEPSRDRPAIWRQACDFYDLYFDPAHPDDKYELVWGFDGYAIRTCGATPTIRVDDRRECGQGVINRDVIVSFQDPKTGGVVTYRDRQEIWVIDCDPFFVSEDCFDDEDCIDWPLFCQQPDPIDGCGADLDPYTNPDLGFPVVQNGCDDNCALIVVEYNDEILTVEPDACFKVIRTWIVIDWCQYDPLAGRDDDGDNPNQVADGRWEYIQVINVRDKIDPVIDVVIGDFCQPAVKDSATGICFGYIEICAQATDECSPDDWLVYDYKIDAFSDGVGQFGDFDFYVGKLTLKQFNGGTSLTQGPLDCDAYNQGGYCNPFAADPTQPFCASGDYPVGVHTIYWFVEDGCGNVTKDTTMFEILDCKQPTPYCKTGIVTVVMPVNGEICIWASDLDDGSFDNCTNQEDLKFYFNGDTSMTEFCVNCDTFEARGADDKVLIDVEVWVEDEEGNADFCITTIEVQDNQDVCDNTGSLVAVNGEVENIMTQDMVENVQVDLGGTVNPDLTGDDGLFAFKVDPVLDFTVTPYRNDDPLNGVSTKDLVAIQRHLLGMMPFTSGYHMIAADVNNNADVAASDISALRKVILGTETDFSVFNGQTSWRFIDARDNLADNTDPWPFNEVIGKDVDIQAYDFHAVKVGDVSGDAQSNGAVSNSTRSNGQLILAVEDADIVAGDSYVMEVTSENFDAIAGYQFTMKYDANALNFSGINSGAITVTEGNLGLQGLADGVITMSWNDANGQATTVTDGQVLFTITFDAALNAKASDVIRATSEITKAEAYGADLDDRGLTIEFRNGNRVVEVFELYQNTPNPFEGTTVISYTLPQDMPAVLTVYDVAGKVVLVKEVSGEKGYNEVEMSKAQLNGAGVLYYQLDAANYTATKRMVLID